MHLLEDTLMHRCRSRDYLLSSMEQLLIAHATRGDVAAVSAQVLVACRNARLTSDAIPSSLATRIEGHAATWRRHAAWARWSTRMRTCMRSCRSSSLGTRASSPPHETTDVVASSHRT